MDAVAVEEVGDPDALADLAERLEGEWWHVTSGLFEGTHPIRVGFLSRLPIEVIADTADFPAQLEPVQVSDSGNTITRMGRGALAVKVRERDGRELTLIGCHDRGQPRATGGRRARWCP